jgi:hypothetical protein
VGLPPVTPELVLFVLVGPPLVSAALTVAGLYTRRRRLGVALVALGILGMILSALWLLLVLRVEAVVQ